MRLIDKYKKSLEVYETIVPYSVWTTLPCEDKGTVIRIMGDQICLGGDYKDLSEVKDSFEWLVEQFGGVILWDVE